MSPYVASQFHGRQVCFALHHKVRSSWLSSPWAVPCVCVAEGLSPQLLKPRAHQGDLRLVVGAIKVTRVDRRQSFGQPGDLLLKRAEWSGRVMHIVSPGAATSANTPLFASPGHLACVVCRMRFGAENCELNSQALRSLPGCINDRRHTANVGLVARAICTSPHSFKGRLQRRCVCCPRQTRRVGAAVASSTACTIPQPGPAGGRAHCRDAAI